ncbi:MAG: T9SS type A sorting domain-containing protein [Sediminibacterium sp.]|nr:T9SS type A sorting domain-containing protein [Sediminibacterium sp.]
MNKLKTLFFTGLIAHAASGQIIQNGNLEQGTIPTNIDQMHKATGWSKGCGVYTSNGVTTLSTPDLCDKNTNVGNFCHIPFADRVNARNTPGITNNRFAHIMPATDYGPNGFFGETVKATITEPLSSQYRYKISIYAARGLGFPAETIHPNQLQFVLRKNDDCSIGKTVLTTGDVPVLNFGVTATANWSQHTGYFSINAQDAAVGYNRIEVRGLGIASFCGILIDDFEITKELLPVPAITTLQNSFCANTPLTFNGTLLAGTCQTHLWEIQECTSTGALIGNPIHSMWISGTPGTYTFPSSLNLPCNKYYRIKLSPSNNIPGEWIETTKIIQYVCMPTVNAGPDQTICAGGCASIAFSASPMPVKLYNVSGGQSTLIGTYSSSPILVCPTSNTTYNIQSAYSCGFANDNVNITVLPSVNVSAVFNLVKTPVNATTFNLSASFPALPAGASQTWLVEKVLSSGSVISSHLSTNFPCWQLAAGATNNNFIGYPTPSNLPCNSTTNGVFTESSLYFYRITRTVSYMCGLTQTHVEATRMIAQARTSSLQVVQETAPLNVFSISPNPSNGAFELHLTEGMENADITVFNITGKVVLNMKTSGLSQAINLSQQEKGLYYIMVTSGLDTFKQTLLLE